MLELDQGVAAAAEQDHRHDNSEGTRVQLHTISWFQATMQTSV
jgi:hypothetical protein